jgi:hypothetical protein
LAQQLVVFGCSFLVLFFSGLFLVVFYSGVTNFWGVKFLGCQHIGVSNIFNIQILGVSKFVVCQNIWDVKIFGTS